ncbi:MAG: DegT/DnrJ/EryC1/StrS family aminotransferase [Gemmatimonadaceae bacterium]
MPFRRQLTVASPLSAADIAGAARDTIAGRDLSGNVRTSLAGMFDARAVLLTDSGTSALVLALRAFAKPLTPVAMPAYACLDLIAAAQRARVRVRFFDVDPQTLSPDMDSLRRVLAQGVSAIVVAHLYGFPADMVAVMKAAADAGVPVIEDAAQHASATVAHRPTGSFGDVSVLSFGRGKGTTSGRGGALLVRNDSVAIPQLPASPVASALAIATASWMLGRPWTYGIPASIPALHLGETVYHEAGEPAAMARDAAALLDRTLPGMSDAAILRRANAAVLRDVADQSRHIAAVHPVSGGNPGYLRFPILLRGERHDEPALGIAAGYPNPLSSEKESLECMIASKEPLHGAHALARRLVTLPTHHLMGPSDLVKTSHWLRQL